MNASRKVPQLTPRGTRHVRQQSRHTHALSWGAAAGFQVDKYLSYLAAVDVGGSKGRTRGLEKRGLPSAVTLPYHFLLLLTVCYSYVV